MVKVLVKSYRIPMVLLIMGPIVLIASSLSSTVRNLELLQTTGVAFILLGLAGWILPELARSYRRSTARRAQYTQPQQPPRRVRPY